MVEFNKDGSLRCNLCGREPCRCGVPVQFVKAYDDLTAALREAKPALLRAAHSREDDAADMCGPNWEVAGKRACADAAVLRALVEMEESDG